MTLPSVSPSPLCDLSSWCDDGVVKFIIKLTAVAIGIISTSSPHSLWPRALSPLSFGRPDPVAEFADKLKSTGNKDEWIQGKRLEPKMRTFAPVIVRGKESEGVKFWGFGKTVYQELLGVIADPDYGDITDATNGRDIGIDRQTPAEAGNQYGKTTVRVKPNMTPITEDVNMLQSIFDNQSDLTELYNEPTYDELKEVLQNYLNPSDETEESVPTNTKEKVAEQTATTTTSDVSDAFDNLFNN